MSENEDEATPGIADEQLPEDLQPKEDNPLAEPLDEDVDTEELDVLEGKHPEQPEQPEDSGESDEQG